MTDFVTLFEVGPRDGLQNEVAQIPTADKIRLVNLLSDSGLSKIEVTSFVSPKWVPQMADARQVMDGIRRKSDVTYGVLTPNLQGLENAIPARPDEVAIFASASEGFSKNNINCSISESLERFAPVAAKAKAKGLPVRGYVSCITDCPFDGPTAPHDVATVAKGLLDLGCYQISLGDTLGHATPDRVSLMLDAVLAVLPADKLAGHFHDTDGTALGNIDISLSRGLRCFDSAIGGLGGCPYAPGAPGNVATESVVEHLSKLGFDTGVDLEKLDIAAQFALTLRTQP